MVSLDHDGHVAKLEGNTLENLLYFPLEWVYYGLHLFLIRCQLVPKIHNSRAQTIVEH